MFFKLIRYDIKVGFASTLKRYLAALLLFPLMLLNFWLTATAVNNAALQNGDLQGVVRGSFGDLMLYTFGGMQKYIPEPGVAFQFPAFWMLLYLLLAYITLYYPFNDLEESGQNILVRSGGRRLWWFSKCIWNVSSVIVFFLLGWLVMLAGTLLMGGPMSMELSSGMQAVLRLNSNFYMSWVSSLALETMLLPPLVMAALSLLQMTLSLFIKPFYSFIVTTSILLVSSYYLSPFLIGNYAMPLRSDRLLEDGVNLTVGIWFAVAVIVISIVVGEIVFQRRDILKGEQ